MNSRETITRPEKSRPMKREELLGKAALNLADLKEWQKERAEKRDAENARELEYWAKEYRAIESTFARHDIGDNLKEFEKWEEDASGAYRKIEQMEGEINFESMYKRDAAERLAAVDGRKSIEAYAGNFYAQRNRAIINAIRESDDEDAEYDEDVVGGLHEYVADYIRASRDTELRRMDVDDYTQRRRDRHNDVIRSINRINHIAEKYGVKPLTFRDFETNDFIYKRELDPSGETDARAEYDRTTVESYIRTAFSRDFREAESGQGDRYYDPTQSLVRQFHEG